MKNRWWLAPCLVLSLGLTPAAFAQGMKSGGMMGGKPLEQQGDATKEKGAEKETDLMRFSIGMCNESLRNSDSADTDLDFLSICWSVLILIVLSA